MLGGGVLIFLSTFLDWLGFGPFGFNAYSGDAFGFTGILLLVLSLEIIVVTAIGSFAPDVSLPDELLGFTMNELTLLAGFAAFVWGFSITFLEGNQEGTLLCALGGIAVVAGAIIEQKEEAVAQQTRTI
jgi:hypothetical protein